jgi:hypothetical protein
MQTAHCLLSLGGDHGNQVMKHGVTAAEIAVLRAIHGNDAVQEIEPAGHVKRSHREERERLLSTYGAAKGEDDKLIVVGMFPGVAARVFESLDELGVPDGFFKATGRLSAADNAKSQWPTIDPDTGPTVARWVEAGYLASNYPPQGYNSKSTQEEIDAAIAAQAEPEAPAFDADDEVGEDIHDGHTGTNEDVLG